MGRLMSSLATTNNNDLHESNPIYNYKFPTSISNNFNDNYYFCGYKCKKNSVDRLIFDEEKFFKKMEFNNCPSSLPLSFTTEKIKPISFNIFSRRNSFEIIQLDDLNKIKLQFTFDADYSCQIDIFYCAVEKFSNGLLTYSVKPNLSYKNTSIHPPGPCQLFEYEFNNLEYCNFGNSLEYEDMIPFVVLISTLDESCKDKQQFVTHLYFEWKSEQQIISGAQVIVQKLVHHKTIFIIQDMYGADPLSEQDVLNNASQRSSVNDIKGDYLALDQNHSVLKLKSDSKRNNFIQDCVICMASVRDTLVLPCRHLCLCSSCGEKLLHQSPSCPICRSTFRALLQIENLEKFLMNQINQ